MINYFRPPLSKIVLLIQVKCFHVHISKVDCKNVVVCVQAAWWLSVCEIRVGIIYSAT